MLGLEGKEGLGALGYNPWGQGISTLLVHKTKIQQRYKINTKNSSDQVHTRLSKEESLSHRSVCSCQRGFHVVCFIQLYVGDF